LFGYFLNKGFIPRTDDEWHIVMEFSNPVCTKRYIVAACNYFNARDKVQVSLLRGFIWMAAVGEHAARES
jgi:hypothetical protein